ncbi:MAG: DEAD/DEAH box helicase [Bacteroidales bacterium]|nr:DEAD/DEAH box helicase [Bacteroidales bacterium]
MTFDELNLTKNLRKSLAAMELTTPTPIQEKTFSVALSGRDILGIAQTGTGKTLAYLLPTLSQWKFSKDHLPQIVVLVPTRELVVQVVETAKRLVEGTSCMCVGVFGGVGMMPQAEAVVAGADVLIGTPGRLLDLVLNGYVKLRGVKKLVVDEVDEMLEQGFRTQLGRLFDLLPTKRQNLLFSATMTEAIAKLADTYFNNPTRIEAAPVGTPLEGIEQVLYKVPNFNTKVNLLSYLLQNDESMSRVLVFVSTMALADTVYEAIAETFGEDIDYIHSKRTQSQRFRALRNFANSETRILIATDLVARGIDIAGVSHVVCFDLPMETEQYIHRIGRTGRADEKGKSITFVSPMEQDKLTEIEGFMHTPIAELALPEDLEISDKLTKFELPVYRMRNSLVETDATPGGAFHEKLEKNKKVNIHISHKTIMRQKYGKPITKSKSKKR